MADEVSFRLLDNDVWLDTGTPESLFDANCLIKVLIQRV